MQRTRLSRWYIKWIAGLFVGLGTLLVGCATPQQSGANQGSVERARLRISEPGLQQELLEFGDRFKAAVRSGAWQIDEATTDRTIGRRTLIWKARMNDTAREILIQDDPREALLDIYALCIQQHVYFTEGDGQDLFSQQQSVAVQTADELVDEVDRLMHRVLTDQQVESMRGTLREFATNNPIRGVFRIPSQRPSQLAQREGGMGFSTLMNVPLAPFRAVGGVDRTAAAIQDFTQVASRFSSTVQDLPEQTRWQAEMLSYNLEDRETMVKARESLVALSEASNSIAATLPDLSTSAQSFAETSRNFAQTAEELPQRFRTEAMQLFDDIDQRQDNLQRTVSEVRGAVQDIDQSLSRTNEVAQSIERTSAGVAEAGKAWRQTVQTFGEVAERLQGEPGPAEPAEQSKEFDIEQYTSAARETTQLAVELQKVLAELDRANDFVTKMEDSSQTTIQTAAAHLNGSLRIATINIFLLIVGTATVMLLYRFIVMRLLPQRDTKNQ